MMGILGGLFGGIFKWLLGLLTGKAKPKIEDYADSNARAQEQLASERATNDILTEGSAARAAADARRMRRDDGPANAVNSDPDAPINRDPDGHYRD